MIGKYKDKILNKKILDNFFMSNNFHIFEKIRMAILGPAPDWSWVSGLHGALGFFVPGRVCPMSGWNRGVFRGT